MEYLVQLHERGHELESRSFDHLRQPSKREGSADRREVLSSRRGTNPGINSGRLDLACLRAFCIDNRFDHRRSLSPMIDEAKRQNGWLICTHDMARQP